MTRRSHQAMSAAVAGACLTLCACGATRMPAAGGPSSAATTAGKARSGAPTGHFCDDAISFMRHIPTESTSKHPTPAEATANLRAVLTSTLRGYTRLRSEAPARLREPLTKIIAVYRSDQRLLRRSGDLAAISQSMVQGNASGASSFEKMVKYISVSCPDSGSGS